MEDFRKDFNAIKYAKRTYGRAWNAVRRLCRKRHCRVADLVGHPALVTYNVTRQRYLNTLWERVDRVSSFQDYLEKEIITLGESHSPEWKAGLVGHHLRGHLLGGFAEDETKTLDVYEVEPLYDEPAGPEPPKEVQTDIIVRKSEALFERPVAAGSSLLAMVTMLAWMSSLASTAERGVALSCSLISLVALNAYSFVAQTADLVTRFVVLGCSILRMLYSVPYLDRLSTEFGIIFWGVMLSQIVFTHLDYPDSEGISRRPDFQCRQIFLSSLEILLMYGLRGDNPLYLTILTGIVSQSVAVSTIIEALLSYSYYFIDTRSTLPSRHVEHVMKGPLAH